MAGRPYHLRGSRRWQHSSGNVPCDSCAVLRWLPGLGSSPGINHTIWYRQSRSVSLAGMKPVFQGLAGALSNTCTCTRIRHWLKVRCGNGVIASDFNPTPDNATTAPYPWFSFRYLHLQLPMVLSLWRREHAWTRARSSEGSPQATAQTLI